MQTELAANIRQLRRQFGLTQQQLADAMAVTVGAVHKWEQGLSTPDIRVIMDLARYFSVTVDALVGYRMEPRDRTQVLKALEKIRLEKTYAFSRETVASALRQYPNDFDIVYACGTLCHLAGVESGNRDQLQMAIDLLKHAGNLLPSASEAAMIEIYEKIGLAYLDLGNREEGLKQLALHNPCGVLDSVIGMELAEDPEQGPQARTVLANAMVREILSLHHIVSGLETLLAREKNYREAASLLSWFCSFLKAQQIPGKISFLHKDLSVSLASRAAYLLKTNSRIRARAAMKEALSLARAFDRAPDYSTGNLRYCRAAEPRSTYDGAGSTALEAIRFALQDLAFPEALELFEEVQHEV